MSENIEIKIEDKVNSSISIKLLAIENAAVKGHFALARLQLALDNLKPKGLAQLENAVSKSQAAIDKAALSSQRLATEQQKTARAAALNEIAQNKLNAANAKGVVNAANAAAAQQKLAAASMNAEAALNKAVVSETNAAIAATKLQTAQQSAAIAAANAGVAQQGLAAATSNAAAASARAVAAATQGQTAQQALAAATARTGTAQTQGATAAQRLATETQRTAVQAANAAAASDRAALAALRLAQAQEKAAQASQRSASGLMSYVRGAAALAGVGLSAGAILSAADAYTVLQNKLRIVADSQEQVNQLTAKLSDIANETRSDLTATATSFARFDNALISLGKSQEDTLRLQRTVNKLFVIGGATAAEQSGALIQLSQAFNANVLSGEEFRSVSENMPKQVRKAIAEILKINESGLKKAASDGKITGEVLFKAFNSLNAFADSKFGETVTTLSQAVTVFKNKFTEAWGEINSSLGITAGLSALIIGLANNLDILAIAVAAVGAAMTVYFGPNLISMLGKASAAVKAFTLVIASNPVGLIAVAITTALVALVAFSDRIKLTADGAVTLRDGFMTAWAYIKDAAKIAADFVGNAWNTAIDVINDLTDGWAENFRDIGNAITQIAKFVINNQIASWVAGYRIIIATWNNFPGAMEAFFISVANNAITQIEFLVNAWQTGLRAIAKAAESIAPELSKGLASALDNMTIDLPKIEGSKAAKDFSAEIGGIVSDAFSQDYVGKGVDAFMKRAREIAAQRRKSDALRGAGTGTTGAIDGDGKSAEKRARALQMVNKQLDDELSRMFMLKPEREIQQKFDQIESELLRKKITLNDQEANAIKSKLRAIEEAKFVQQEFDRIYESSIEPARTKNAVQEAANKLLTMGAITQDKYNQELVKASEAYKTATDPLYKHNRELEQQMTLLKLMPKEREIEQSLMQITNDLLTQGIVLDDKQLQSWREKLKTLQELNAVAQIQNQLQADSNAQKAIDLSNAVKGASSSGLSDSDAIGGLASMMPSLQQTSAYFQFVQEGYANMYAAIDELRQADLLSEQDANLAKFETFRQQSDQYFSAASNALGALASLQSSENKKQAAIGKKAAIAQTIIQTYQSATSAFSSLASIPYVGPFLGAAAAAAAIAGGLANVQRIRSTNPGFKEGGYTGNMPTNAIAGPVHGQEFVFDANATRKIGVGNLEAMRRNGVVPKTAVEGKSNATSSNESYEDKGKKGVNYNQQVYVTVAGKRDRKTAGQQARDIRRESTREFIRNGA